MDANDDNSETYVIEASEEVSYNTLAREIYWLWDQAHQPGTLLNTEAKAQNCAVDLEASGERSLSVSKSAAGLDHSTVELVVTFLGGGFAHTVGRGAATASRDLWYKVILPYLVDRYGTNALKRKPKSDRSRDADRDGE
ncbi:hypothetical protein [Burkholderia sp. Se-20378]|uniref:hypothetical protein n=1 Tax=Burkholderia sp. Se-20378 TaxID=2703899 RepID=UPI001981724E|nr:hypothetical protein [Burkholderia sp. Se-20378]MBN3769786.1 hypothetical protein [Burkholderia sp. Se-20378]